ncbi:GNAT family N-acetyltransferase [Labedaea rhizosphaerae]|uniref:GNAT family N-acetyltransferase n=1 Tax=Labedaea rhizosphaerae TaxID=598644 RepID=UPI001061143C|nr:GNAT family N-acetyltransferase [Labedaea rhizosphaerae]
MAIVIRQHRNEDLAAVAALYNRFDDNPNPLAGGVTAAEIERELADRETAAFLVATDGEEIVGTFGLFRNTGRRSARAGELIADMFFVAPAYRNGVLTGRLFTEAVEFMFSTNCLVLRLTVNPANTPAFRLYRRVGCVAIGVPIAGEDGNVELYNYIPLILRGVIADLPQAALAALGSLASFGGVTRGRDDDLRSDLIEVDGLKAVRYDLLLGEHRITAVVDVDAGRVHRVELITPDGAVTPLRHQLPPPGGASDVDSQVYAFGDDALRCEVDGRDGTVRVRSGAHSGPLYTSTWPSIHADRVAGWREAQPVELAVTEVDGGVRMVERAGDDSLTGTVTLVDGVLTQRFESTVPVRRVFGTVGLRQGRFAVTEPGKAAESHPIGLGLGVRDSTEIVSAARALPAGTELAWLGGSAEVRVQVAEPTTLVHSTLLARRPDPVLRTTFAVPDRGSRVKVSAKAGGVTSWVDGGHKVLRSPHPRTAAFASNPRWRAGLWVTTERARHDRESGLGWGAGRPGWEEKNPRCLVHPDQQLVMTLDLPVVEVAAPAGDGEVVCWLTPHTPATTTVLVDQHGTRTTLSTDDFRQVWASTVDVQLTDGRWLAIGPAGGADQEIVVRATAAGVLVGCVSAADGNPAAWHFTIHSGLR